MRDDRLHAEIFLASLAAGMPGLTAAYGAVLAEAASICLEERGHGSPTELAVDGDLDADFALHSLTVDAQMRRSHEDQDRATEHGACGVAILAVRQMTGLTVLRQSRRGTGFDYWLGPQDAFLFQDAFRLEISGIRKGGEPAIRSRIRRKIGQTGDHLGPAPVIIAVVEFGRPLLRLAIR
jgi:hypothetical protein